MELGVEAVRGVLVAAGAGREVLELVGGTARRAGVDIGRGGIGVAAELLEGTALIADGVSAAFTSGEMDPESQIRSRLSLFISNSIAFLRGIKGCAGSAIFFPLIVS